MKRLSVLAGLALTLVVAPPAVSAAEAQEAVFLVRHAERPASNADSISAVGAARAAALASLLRNVGITAILTSEALRTIQTAEPLARDLGLDPERIGGRTAEAQVRNTLERLGRLGPEERVLVVGHSNTLPMLLVGLGHEGEVTIREDEHDALFIVFPRDNGPPAVVTMRY